MLSTPQITTRVRGLASWRPQAKTLRLLETVRAVLDEYAEYLPLTIRQIFYRLVGAHSYAKTEDAYEALGEKLNRARRAGFIDFEDIRDDEVQRAEPVFWDSERDLIETFVIQAEQFRLDRQEGQGARLLFVVEAAGMLPQIERIADPFGITVQSCGGFDSLTEKYKLAGILGRFPCSEVLHIGDHDPSGTHMFSSVGEDVIALAQDLDLPGDITFTRLAVTPQQIRDLRLDTAFRKESDKRKFDGELTTQAEAIAPDVLAQIVTDAINARVDPAIMKRVLDREQRSRERLTPRISRLLDEEGAP